MSGYLPYEITKSIEEVITDPELAKKVIEAIEESLSIIEERAKEQKVIIKTELKNELTKEIVTKDELKVAEERLSGEIKAIDEIKREINEVRGEINEIKREINEVKGEINEIRREINEVKGEIRTTEERLRTEIHKWRADTIKWMFVFWLGQLVAFVGILRFMLK